MIAHCVIVFVNPLGCITVCFGLCLCAWDTNECYSHHNNACLCKMWSKKKKNVCEWPKSSWFSPLKCSTSSLPPLLQPHTPAWGKKKTAIRPEAIKEIHESLKEDLGEKISELLFITHHQQHRRHQWLQHVSTVSALAVWGKYTDSKNNSAAEFSCNLFSCTLSGLLLLESL